MDINAKSLDSSHRRELFPTSMRRLVAPGSLGSRVAIVTRTKNRPILLARALASVLSQTHQNWHLYLVNDGGDPQPVDKLVERHQSAFAGRISVLQHPQSLGMEAASNAALAVAEGDFIVVHDDDDSWKPPFLATAVEFLNRADSSRYAAVVANCTVVRERIDGNSVIEEGREAWGFWRDHVDLATMLSRNAFPPIGLLIRKSVVDAVGPYNPALPVLGDWDYNLRILMVGDIATIPEPLVYYHQRRAQDSYGNSVVSGASQHERYDVLYRNSMVRELLAKEPRYLGLIHVLMRHAEEEKARLLSRIEQMQCAMHSDREMLSAHLSRIEQMQNAHLPTLARLNTALRPLRAIWRRGYPVRRVVAKLRRRI